MQRIINIWFIFIMAAAGFAMLVVATACGQTAEQAASTTMTPTGEDSTSAASRRLSASTLRRRVRMASISRFNPSFSFKGSSGMAPLIVNCLSRQ